MNVLLAAFKKAKNEKDELVPSSAILMRPGCKPRLQKLPVNRSLQKLSK